MYCFVDACHARENSTRRSRSDFNILLQMEPIYYCLESHIKFETSTYGKEFMDTNLACEYIHGLQYKLRMMGIPFSDPCFMYGDNKSVLYNTALPEST